MELIEALMLRERWDTFLVSEKQTIKSVGGKCAAIRTAAIADFHPRARSIPLVHGC
jgi:hypothetical protein